MASAARKLATYDDVLAAPEHLVAEVIDGDLHLQPRPARRHALALTRVSGNLEGPFDRGVGGPGGWLILHEPELHLGSPTQILVPDLAGWRLERATFDGEGAFFDVAPDWVCEVLSPATARMDRGAKRDIYAAAGVAHLWLLNPIGQQLEAFVLTAGKWLLAGVVSGADEVALPPFEAVPFSLGQLWPFDQPNAPAGDPQT